MSIGADLRATMEILVPARRGGGHRGLVVRPRSER